MLYCETRGKPGGHAIVFLHGYLGDRRDWFDIVRRLGPDFHCICVDLPGHGLSPDIEANPAPTIVDVANDIIEIVDDLGIDHFSLCGYSMGGRTALYIATQFAMRVDHLFLESTVPGIMDPAARTGRRAEDLALAANLCRTPFEPFLREWYAQPLFEGIDVNPDAFEAMIKRRLDGNPEHLARALDVLGQGVFPSLWHELKQITLPALLITGSRDRKYCDIAAAMAAACPAMRQCVLDGAGHNVHFEQPAEYTQALQSFMARHKV